MNVYSQLEIALSINCKIDQLQKMCKGLEKQGYKFEVDEGGRIFTDEDLTILIALKNKLADKKITMKDAVSAILEGNLNSFPVLSSVLPHDSAVTNNELLQAINRAYLDRQNDGLQAEEQHFQVIDLLTTLIHKVEAVEKNQAKTHNVAVATHTELTENTRLNRDIMKDIRILQNSHEKQKKKPVSKLQLGIRKVALFFGATTN
jgi:hypothetical protein